jgi:hypothetical protein
MFTSSKSAAKLAVVVAGLVTASVASASTVVQYTYTGETLGGITMGIDVGGHSGSGQVGQFIMTTTNPNFTSTLLTYCTDVGVTLQNTYNYTGTQLSAATGVAPNWITGGIQNAATLWYNDKSKASTVTQYAGIQLAIWELLYNTVKTGVNPYSASTFSNNGNGGFYITTTDANSIAAENYAASVLNSFSGLPASQNVEWLAPTYANGTIGGSQGLLYQVPGTQTPGTPDASSTLGLLSVAMIGLSAVSRKFASKA